MPPSDDHEDRFAQLYRDFGDLVYATARSITGESWLAEDACQETWVRVDRALRRGDGPRHPTGWLLTIARREARRVLRKKAHVSLVREPEAPTMRPAPEAREERAALDDALSTLAPEERELLVARFLDGRRPRELRARFGLTRSGLWKRIRKLQAGLVRLLEDRS